MSRYSIRPVSYAALQNFIYFLMAPLHTNEGLFFVPKFPAASYNGKKAALRSAGKPAEAL